jgi:hypothetical protein
MPGELHRCAVPAALATGSGRALRLLGILAGCLPQGVPQGIVTCRHRVLAMEMLQICFLPCQIVQPTLRKVAWSRQQPVVPPHLCRRGL